MSQGVADTHLTVVDSGASAHMECSDSDFEYLIPVTDHHGSTPTVSLGDDSLLSIVLQLKWTGGNVSSKLGKIPSLVVVDASPRTAPYY